MQKKMSKLLFSIPLMLNILFQLNTISVDYSRLPSYKKYIIARTYVIALHIL